MRFLGFIFVSLLISTLIISVDVFLPGKFLINFIDNNYIETFSALIGFNLASVTFLLGQLITIEATTNRESLFDSTRKEIKHNSFFLIFSFIVSLLLLSFRPDINLVSYQFTDNVTYYLINIAVITIFLMALFAICEILQSVFSIGKFFKKSEI